jgi:hypothetical protein
MGIDWERAAEMSQVGTATRATRHQSCLVKITSVPLMGTWWPGIPRWLYRVNISD